VYSSRTTTGITPLETSEIGAPWNGPPAISILAAAELCTSPKEINRTAYAPLGSDPSIFCVCGLNPSENPDDPSSSPTVTFKPIPRGTFITGMLTW
jgi:hypothetical protein